MERIRQIGLERIAFGSDGARGVGLTPRDAWASFLKLPFTKEEERKIASNAAPYMK